MDSDRPLCPLQRDLEVEGKVLPGICYCFTSTPLSRASDICCALHLQEVMGVYSVSLNLLSEIHIRITSPKARPCKGQRGVISERKKQNAKVEVVPVCVRKTFPS